VEGAPGQKEPAAPFRDLPTLDYEAIVRERARIRSLAEAEAAARDDLLQPFVPSSDGCLFFE
jgi:hypothetical protein